MISRLAVDVGAPGDVGVGLGRGTGLLVEVEVEEPLELRKPQLVSIGALHLLASLTNALSQRQRPMLRRWQ